MNSSEGTEVESLLRQPKRLALLAYLASPTPGTWHRRDMLLALFWPELDTAHARTSLRNAVYVLRQTLGEEVIRNRGDEEISIDPAFLTTDLSIVWQALREGRIDDALAACSGELLPGLYPPDSEGFNRWLDSERARLRVAISTAAMQRVEDLEKNGKHAQALGIVRVIANINPDDETVVRRMMTLHEAIGDKAGGLAVFESYRSRLAKDYEAEPAQETIEVVNRLRSSTAPLISRTANKDAPHPREQSMADAPTFDRSVLPRRKLSALATSVLIVVVLIAGVAFLTWRRSPRPPSIGRATPLTSDEGLQVEPAISPNGRLIAYAKGNSNRLQIFVQRIDGGDPWPLSGDTTDVELLPRWSPDNDQILFLSRNHAYVSPTLGGKARIVAKGGDGDAMIRSASWSPTGDSIAIVRNDSLQVVPLRGRGARYIGTAYQLHSCVWSPDNKWIACVSGNWLAFTPGPLFGNDAPSTILLYPVRGGKPIVLTNANDESESPAWSPDGKFLWILSNKDGDAGTAYAIPIGGDGDASGDFVRLGINAESISLSSHRVAYSVPAKKANLWSLPIPRDSAVSLSAATRMTNGNQVIEVISASRDGKWIAYDSNLTGNADIYRIPVSGGAPERLTEDPRPEFAPELSPDGTELAWHRWIGPMRRLFVKKLDGENEKEILSSSGDQGVPRWSSDGRRLVAWGHRNERGGVFVAKRSASGKWMKMWQLDYGQLPIWSPDDRQILFVKLDGSVQSIPADSGAVTTIYSAGPRDPQATYLKWSPDPDVIWMLATQGPTQSFWALSRSTGRIRLLARLHDPAGKSIGPAITADSSHFYFPVNERSSNVRWAALH